MTTSEPPSSGGPVLQLLAAGLQYWIRGQCEMVESLELKLNGSALQLLRGHLEGVSLMARRVVYQGLQIELVELQSDPMTVPLGRLLRTQSLQLEQPFGIRGKVAFTAAGLTRSLTRPQWRELSDHLGEQLLGLVPLLEVRIVRDSLVFAARAVGESRPVELETRPAAVDGAVEIHDLDGTVRARLPGDPNIRIELATIEGGMLQLHGEARVSP